MNDREIQLLESLKAERDSLARQLGEALARADRAEATHELTEALRATAVARADKAEEEVVAKTDALIFSKADALDEFTVWLLKTHGLLIDESLLLSMGPPRTGGLDPAGVKVVREALEGMKLGNDIETSVERALAALPPVTE